MGLLFMPFSATNSVLLGAWYNWLIPLWLVALGAVGAVGLLLAVYGLLVLTLPKLAAIARISAKETCSQPLFYVLLVLGAGLILLFSVIPYNTFGEDLKEMKISSLQLIMGMSVFLAVWSASVSISDELEGRTALTLLSKPVGRRQFIVGKFLGVLAPVFIMFIVLGVIFLAAVSYKVKYDARELMLPEPLWQQCQQEMLQIVPGLVLAFLETMVLAAISVAISTRLPKLPNLVICASIYVIGHLVPLLVQSAVGKLPIVTFVGQFLATVLPVLDHFNIQAAVAAGRDVPLSYLAWVAGYSVLYSTIAMLVALIMFEDRDLA